MLKKQIEQRYGQEEVQEEVWEEVRQVLSESRRRGEEIPSSARPIEAVGTAAAAFVGFARRQRVRAAVVALAAAAAVTAVVRATRT